MIRLNKKITLFYVFLGSLLSLLFIQCKETYEPIGHAKPISIETIGLELNKIRVGFYKGTVGAEGQNFTIRITDPQCSWMAISGKVGDREYFQWEDREVPLEESWGKITCISNSHPYEFNVMINPNTFNKEKIITLDFEYGNSFGTLKLTQLAE